MKITIPKPCHENWENMTADEKGRFCSVCSKTVQDFTAFSDEELVTVFASDENRCGRFREDQLERNLNWSAAGKFAVGLLVISGTLTTINAQEVQPQEVKTIQSLQGSIGKAVINEAAYHNGSIRIGAPVSRPAERPLILVNNKRISEEELRMLKSENIKTVNTLSPKDAIERYGTTGKNGAIMITTKKKR